MKKEHSSYEQKQQENQIQIEELHQEIEESKRATEIVMHQRDQDMNKLKEYVAELEGAKMKDVEII